MHDLAPSGDHCIAGNGKAWPHWFCSFLALVTLAQDRTGFDLIVCLGESMGLGGHRRA